ncbi:MAG: ATP synthase F1 subunit epsilon [Lachnospiraceae bacterium]|nr:ATP synthase F1 subunit epsilon [Lachnospiraceae bacterium]
MADKLFKVQVICPERVFYEGECDLLELKTTEGDIGILAGHIPLTAIIAPGAMKIKNGAETKVAALHDGFIEVLTDKVLILAESCEWPDEIDLNRAKEAKVRAERRLKGADGEIDVKRAEFALRKALLRIDLCENK